MVGLLVNQHIALQAVKKLSERVAQNRMTPAGRDLRQRFQDEFSCGKFRMRDGQAWIVPATL